MRKNGVENKAINIEKTKTISGNSIGELRRLDGFNKNAKTAALKTTLTPNAAHPRYRFCKYGSVMT
jgi:hypothetical protein